MSVETLLDQAHRAMLADLDDDTARLQFYERLADDELFLLLTDEASGGELSPEVFELEADKYVLVFDREERLAEFVGEPAPYAAMPGRAIAALLAGRGIGLGVNLGVAPSSILIPEAAVGWLTETLSEAPEESEDRIAEIGEPLGYDPRLLTVLSRKLEGAGGLARCACLASVRYRDGREGLLLGFIAPVGGAEPALARAAHEALVFSGLEQERLDVGFFAEGDALGTALERVALVIDLPEPRQPEQFQPSAPGMDPDKPPILK